VISSPPALFGRVALLAVLSTAGALAAGCSQLLGISQITAATDAAGDDANKDTPAVPIDSSAGDVAGEAPAPDSSPSDRAISGDSNTDARIIRDSSSPEASTNEAGADAAPCTQDLSGIKAGGFYISFTLQTAQPDTFIAIVNQRDICANGVFWDLRLLNGQIYLEFCDHALGLTIVRSGANVLLNDGKAHAVVVRRMNGQVQLTIDGMPSGSGVANQSFAAGELGPLRSGTDVCDGVKTMTAAFDDTLGSIMDLCVRPQ